MRVPDRIIIVGALAFSLTMVVPAASGNDLTVTSFSSYIGQTNIVLQATGNVIFSGGAMSLPALPAGATSGQLVVEAGNDITVNDGSAIIAGTDWSVTMVAGTSFSGTNPAPGSDGIYLNGSAYLQTQNGDISLSATNEIIVGTGAIRTLGGGNIGVTAEYGNVNSGTGTYGFTYNKTAPYYTPSPSLRGISTAAGGNLTINAGGDVIGFPTTTVSAGDAGIGTFGPEPGNVTVTAGGNVYGQFVVMNGTGTITAGQNIGTPAGNQNVALSLAKGNWNLNAQNNIYLQEVRNPNGVFNNTTISPINHNPSAGNHLFDYDPQASVTLTAGNGVYITGFDIPRPDDPVPMLLPPALIINAGAGGVTLDTPNAVDGSGNPLAFLDNDIALFPSPYGNLQITTTNGGPLTGGDAESFYHYLLMSDSAHTQWYPTNSGIQIFGALDHASVPLELNNTNPVAINISGDMDNMVLVVDKPAQIAVDGNMNSCSFYGENLYAGDATSINVGGEIYYPSSTNVTTSGAIIIGGTGEFDVAANSISLGNSLGILSVGNGGTPASPFLGQTYSFLTPYIASGATINVTVTNDLNLVTSAIATLGGGNINVTNIGGSMEIGSSNLVSLESQIMNDLGVGLGIYTSGGGDINVTASGTINVDSSRIATFDGGNIFVESLTGDVNAGSGSSMTVPVNVFSPAAVVGEPYEYVYASGIVALTLANPSRIPGSTTVPGNITVLSPQGNISASQGGVLQEVLNGSLPAGPTITLAAGTPGVGGWGSTNPPVYIGNVYLGNSGVIGGTITVEATGKIIGIQSGLIASISQTNGVLTVSWNLEGGQLNAQEIPVFVVETSTNLVDWTITNPSISTNADGSLSFESPIPTDSSCGFYRIGWQ